MWENYARVSNKGEKQISLDLNINWEDVINWVTKDRRVDNAVDFVENNIVRNGEAPDWMIENGWRVTGEQNGSQALRHSATRDATIFSLIQNFYDRDNDSARILEAYTRQGFNNGSTTHTHLINMGPDSLVQSNSNHQATLVVDESQDPPVIALNFRGSNMGGTPESWQDSGENRNPLLRIFDIAMHLLGVSDGGNTTMPEWLTHFKGFQSTLMGGHASSYQTQANAFWEDAGPDITRVINEVRARHPNAAPQIILSGHSYGVDGASRIVQKLAGAVPDLVGQIELIGYGGISSLTDRERQQIHDLLGGEDSGRAVQYINSDDTGVRALHINPFGNEDVGEQRVISGVGPDGHQYELSARAMAMMEVVEDAIDDDPSSAMENARAVVAAYRANPDSFLDTLSEYTSNPPSGGNLLSMLVPNRGQENALA